MWQYRARLSDRGVVDGDTCELVCDLGFGVHRTDRFRVLGINAPERFTPDGIQASAFARAWFAFGSDNKWPLIASTAKDRDKYGRFLANITRADGSDLAESLVTAGLAIRKIY